MKFLVPAVLLLLLILLFRSRGHEMFGKAASKEEKAAKRAKRNAREMRDIKAAGRIEGKRRAVKLFGG